MTDPSLPSEPAIDVALLMLLLEASGPMRAVDLARQLNGTRDAIVQALDDLQRAGVCFEGSADAGLVLVEAGLNVWLDYLQLRFGYSRPMQVYRATRSTQDVCRQLVQTRGRSAHGGVVAADEQSAGRGRLGRRWQAPAGTAVMFSLVHCMNDKRNSASTNANEGTVERVTFATSVALATALERWLRPAGANVMIRWPNDLYVQDEKLGGILVETMQIGTMRAAIIGVGLNVALVGDSLDAARRDCGAAITSVQACGGRAPRLAILGDAIASLDAHLTDHTRDEMLQRWRSRSTLLGQYVTLQCAGRPISGTVVDLDPDAGLIVRTDHGALTHLPAANTTLVA